MSTGTPRSHRFPTARARLDAELSFNAARTLAVVAGFLLDGQIRAQADSFEAEGGFTERLYRVRSRRRMKRGREASEDNEPGAKPGQDGKAATA